MDLQSIGRILLVVGIGVTLFGGLLLLLGKVPILNNFGRLPGDIRIQNGNFSCFAPITSMILLSIVLSIIANIVIRLMGK